MAGSAFESCELVMQVSRAPKSGGSLVDGDAYDASVNAAIDALSEEVSAMYPCCMISCEKLHNIALQRS